MRGWIMVQYRGLFYKDDGAILVRALTINQQHAYLVKSWKVVCLPLDV